MQKVLERIILALVLVALVLAVCGLIFSNSSLTYAGLVVLMVAAVAYAAVQVIMYLKSTDLDEANQMKWFAIITVVVALGIVCVGVLMMTGKISMDWLA